METKTKSVWVVVNSGWYRNDGTDQQFTNKKEAKRMSRSLNSCGCRTYVEEVEQ